MEEKLEAAPSALTSPIEALTREELLQKYKGLLGIAKKAKLAKDELVEENRRLKESILQSETQKDADKQALLTMKETLEQFTKQKLKLTNEFSDLQKKNKVDGEALTKLRIENESLERQLNRVNNDNETLLKDIDRMEDQLKQVNILGLEQKKHLSLLELEVNKLREVESLNNALQGTVSIMQEENNALKEQENYAKQSLEELTRKYSRVRQINTEQRQKFNTLKERFVEVHRKLENLKECKRVLLETQHEYAEAISKWQKEIVNASKLIFIQMNALEKENKDLRQRIQTKTATAEENSLPNVNVSAVEKRLQEILELTKKVRYDLQEKDTLLAAALHQNEELQKRILILNKKTGNTESKHLNQELSELGKQLDATETRLSGGESDQYKQHAEYKELMQHLKALEMERDSLKQRCKFVEELQRDKECLKNEIENLLLKLKDFKQVREDLQNAGDVIKMLEQDKIALLELIRKHECEQQHIEENNKTTADNYAELQNRYKQMEQEHSDLLCEMRELNEALKGRGDMISRQQEKQQELMNELRKTNAKLKQIDDVLLQKDAAIAEKEAKVLEITHEIDITRQKTRQLEFVSTQSEEQLRILNEELQTLRSNLGTGAVADTQSDILSTSTISRAEEMTRMREVDDSFEEKYNKLRSLAVKLKKKLHEQTAQMSEVGQQQTVHVSLNAELGELRKQHSHLQKLNSEQQQLIDALKLENQKLKAMRKQANVLNLEIEATEKSLNDATTKLAVRTNELEKANEQIISKEHTITQLRKEITIVESAKEAEVCHAKELKYQVDLLQKQLQDTLHAKQGATEYNKQLEEEQERLKQEREELGSAVSQCAAETAAVVRVAQQEKDEAVERLGHTEKDLRELQIKHDNVVSALENLRAEHSEYKQKAQAVLRKHQTTGITRDKALSEELIQLRTNEEKQREAIATQTKELATLQQHNADLYLDNETLQRRVEELETVIGELRQQNERLLHEQRNQLQAQQTASRSQRQQLEAQQECHKQQLLELEIKYQRQIEFLRSEKTDQTLVLPKRLPTTIGGATSVLPLSTNASLAHTNTCNNEHQMQSELLKLTEREDAEGSDEVTNTTTANAAAVGSVNQQVFRKISNSSSRSQHDFMPLEELLNAPMHEFQTDTITTSLSGNSFGGLIASVNSTEDSLHVELNVTRDLLTKQESRVRHLTALLAENEQDLAKLTQMNDMLKEELRRQERAVEREKHMHNAEYLKNVVLKFLTLTSSDERVRLVPVLNTILKLSRNEIEMLNCVAKGQKLPTESQARGWGSFLPIFGGGGNTN
ncbi:GRIP and coiled-coil domain-containing protein 2 isoform X2 [Eurosta solidaginis]|uniref:GRIP and coiled-coil domain-containing protein 2 isoform X2 n=1 Tax=Eurosta solidaginis TaxID=178769 RepID=UPI00353058C9